GDDMATSDYISSVDLRLPLSPDTRPEDYPSIFNDINSSFTAIRLLAQEFTTLQESIPTNYIESIVAGTNITIDDTDPKNPIISAAGGGGSGIVESIIAGTPNVTINNTDPANPIISVSS